MNHAVAAKVDLLFDPRGGASGIHSSGARRLGIATDEIEDGLPNPQTPAEVGVLVANGEAEIGVHVVVELISVAGIDIVGPLPGDLQNIIVFSAAIMTGAKDTAAAKALVDFLRTPESAKVIKAKGMEPATP